MEPTDWKPMKTVGQGVREIRISEGGNAYRVFCVLVSKEGLYILHAFQKTTEKAEKKDIDLAKRRYREVKGHYINRTYRRSGTLWEGRFRSSITQEEEYVLGCYRYIELNPVRADMVEHPAEYRWSSYRANAQGETSGILTTHALYEAMASDAMLRQHHYRKLFRYQLDPGMVDEIRSATNGNFVPGNDRFKEQITAAPGRRVIPGKSGRPRNED